MKYDEIGYWSEIKLDILRKYASAYSTILNRQTKLKHIYIDAFAGAGKHISKDTGRFVPGSPSNALSVTPPFYEYHLIDLDSQKVKSLEKISREKDNVYIYHGDCNNILLNNVFPKAKFSDYKRALCILDPYGLHLDWKIMYNAGKMKSVEIFLNFPVADMNRNVLWRNHLKVQTSQIERMNMFWGDESWRDAAYQPSPQKNLWGEEEQIKLSNKHIANSFKKRLKEVAGFKYVSKPLPMKNSHNATVYYLFFASQRPVAAKIVDDIFSKYSNYMGS